ncbi:sulfotransferase family 2, cytosolic sulfotransferase 3 [Gadus morhua]|uniref:Sulfotransferase n=1 Tax=Gadus morhua TaxID=8049 RepID=A0A8C4ZLM7_GADMO|nr:sulfotransferase family cytosolic 2B member 1-like [Gadus morhua]
MATTCSDKYIIHRGLLLPKETHTEESLRFAAEFEFKNDDVLIVTYPKSGTTWMQEIIPLLLNGGDLTPVTTIPNWDRVPWFEETRLALVLDKLKSPRVMVSHLPYNLMPSSLSSSKAKVIYVTRNPKDAMVSSFHFHKMANFLDDPGNFQEFMDKFLTGQVMFGKWTDHVKSWKHADLGDRILYTTYEAMVENLPGSLGEFSTFLCNNLSEKTLLGIADHCCFKNMSKNPMSNYSLVPKEFMDPSKSQFLRKGISGDWKNHFSPEQDLKFSACISEEMKGENLCFPWCG